MRRSTSWMAMTGVIALLSPAGVSVAGEFVGIDPYGRAIYAPSGPFPIVPSRVRGPVFETNPGPWASSPVAGPLYYAEPAPAVPGYYRPDPAVAAGAILAFDVDDALGAAVADHAERYR